MRGLDLNVFDFDYDLSWIALLLSPEGNILGRFGGRDAESREKYLDLNGLRYALEEGLKSHRNGKSHILLTRARKAEDYPAGRARSATSCIHCHHVHEFQRAEAMNKGTWRPEHEFRYPSPKSQGIALDPKQGNRVLHIDGSNSLVKGDVILSINGASVRSFADITHRLDRVPSEDSTTIEVFRDGKKSIVQLPLEKGWKEKTDISWRWSLKAIEPEPPVHGEDLSTEERNALGIKEGQFAMRQGPFLSRQARQAGLQVGDVIIGVDAPWKAKSARQFDVFFRLYTRDRDELTLTLLRGKAALRLAMRIR